MWWYSYAFSAQGLECDLITILLPSYNSVDSYLVAYVLRCDSTSVSPTIVTVITIMENACFKYAQMEKSKKNMQWRCSYLIACFMLLV